MNTHVGIHYDRDTPRFEPQMVDGSDGDTFAALAIAEGVHLYAHDIRGLADALVEAGGRLHDLLNEREQSVELHKERIRGYLGGAA